MLHNHVALSQLLKMLAAQITQPSGEVAERSKFVSQAVGASYFRINPHIDSVSFLDTDDKTIINMLFDVVVYTLNHCRKEIDPMLECIYGQ